LKRLAIISTHPIQYNAPWFKMLTERNTIKIKVFYTWSQVEKGAKYDPGFYKNIEWDMPLLEGYEYEFVENTAKVPGSRHYKGIVNPTLIERIKNYDPDAIMIVGWNFDSHLKCLRYFHKKIPVFFRGDSTMLDERPGIRQLLRRIALKLVFKKIDGAFYVGKENKKYFIKHALTESQLLFVPHAIDNKRFAVSPENVNVASEMRKALGIEADKIIFLFCGKFESKKDPNLLVEAFKELKQTELHLVMVGNGEMETDLKAMSEGQRTIHFLPFQNQQNMPAVYQLADVFVLASKGPGETWGLAINEAMAAGKPILVSNKCGAATDLVINGENGYIFPAGNKEALKQRILLLAQNKRELEEMGKISLQKIQAFSFDKMAEAIEHSVINSTQDKIKNS
jgi:glycosyltransferase involved in cell wall biosynthesis